MNSAKNYLNLLLITLISGIGFFQGCSKESQEQIEAPKSEQVETAIVKAQLVGSRKQLTGTVKSSVRSEIGSKVMGEVKSVSVNVGDLIKKGEAFIRIKDDDLKARREQTVAALDGAKARLEVTEKDFFRFEKLYEQQSATQKEWDDIQLNLKASKSNVAVIEGQLKEIDDLLSYTTVRAPYDAIVAAKYISEGDMVGPGQPLITIEQREKFKIQTAISESDIRYIHLNDSVLVNVPAIGTTSYKAKVSNISSSGDPLSKQFLVEIELKANPDLRSGMFAELTILNTGVPQITIPSSALVSRGQLDGVYTLNSENETLLRWVRTGKTFEGNTVVLSGLKAGERYVVNSSKISHDVQKVQSVN